jgi:hypothetical protein
MNTKNGSDLLRIFCGCEYLICQRSIETAVGYEPQGCFEDRLELG